MTLTEFNQINGFPEVRPIENFRKYHSIDNLKDSTILWLHDLGFLGEDTTWIAQEKIHGANFSIYCNGTGVKFGKRSGFIEGDSSFYGHKNLENVLTERTLNLFTRLAISQVAHGAEPLLDLIIFGEICGGFYPGVPTVPGAKQVQRGVNYSPRNEFIVFDIMANGRYLSDLHVAEICDLHGFYQAPVFAQGKFEELAKINPEFPTIIPRHLFGLPDVEDNVAEGFILKPIHPRYAPNGERIILKVKGSKFKEKDAKPTNLEYAPVVIQVAEELGSYITENRLNNVCSKLDESELKPANFGKILGLLVHDAIEEFNKDNNYKDSPYLKLEDDLQHKINKVLSKKAQVLVKKKLLLG